MCLVYRPYKRQNASSSLQKLAFEVLYLDPQPKYSQDSAEIFGPPWNKSTCSDFQFIFVPAWILSTLKIYYATTNLALAYTSYTV